MNTAGLIPEDLWRHPLFEGSAEFRPVGSPLMVEDCVRRLRRLRNMPSTADGSPERIVNAVGRVYEMARKWLGGEEREGARCTLQLLQRIERLHQMAGTGISDSLRARVLAGLCDLVPARLKGYIPAAGGLPSEVQARLDLLGVLVLDDYLSRGSSFKNRYLKRIYRVVDQGLDFNATTDVKRLRPVLEWAATVLMAQKRHHCSYVDVGCAMAGGAPGVRLASEILRPRGLCREIHGADVSPPDREMALRAAREERLLLYATDPVRRPLPRKYQVILLANVHRHLARPAQEQLLGNLFQSLEEGGQLFLNWRFNDRFSPVLCLERKQRSFLLVAEANAV